jgi:hypothetical protein
LNVLTVGLAEIPEVRGPIGLEKSL